MQQLGDSSRRKVIVCVEGYRAEDHVLRKNACGFERSPWRGRVGETGVPFRGLARLRLRTPALGGMLGANEHQEAHNDEDCQYATHGVLYLAAIKAL